MQCFQVFEETKRVSNNDRKTERNTEIVTGVLPMSGNQILH